MNLLLRVFGVRPIDRAELVVTTCPTCGQPVAKHWGLRRLSDLERSLVEFQNDEITTEQFERRVERALSTSPE